MPRLTMRAGNVSTGLRTRRRVKRIKLQWAERMRNNPTPTEAILWDKLRMGRLGYKFRRQAIVRGWIVDFWCPMVKLVVEVDGGYHLRADQRAKDAVRDSVLADLGIETMRFRDSEVLADQQDVCTRIFQRACQRLRAKEEGRRNQPQRASSEAAGSKGRVAP